MAEFNPIYRATLYDADGVTPLTPRAGAPHSDEFKVATASGVTGFQAYLELPRGRRGRIDVLDRRADTGRLTLTLLDRRTGTDNLQRWWTAFTGDADARNTMLGFKMLVEESTDGGGSWASFFTGEVQADGLEGRQRARIVLREQAADALNRMRIFTGRPHSSVAYAWMGNLWPFGGLVRSYGPHATISPVRCDVVAWTAGDGRSGFRLRTNQRDGDPLANPAQLVLTRAVLGSQPYPRRIATLAERLRVHVEILTGARAGETGELVLGSQTYDSGAGGWLIDPFMVKLRDGKQLILSMGVEEVDASDPAHIAMPAAGEQVEAWIFPVAEPTQKAPMLLDTHHPVQRWKDILDGKFARLDGQGAVTRTIPYNAAAFSALIADQTFHLDRLTIEEGEDANDHIEESICKAHDLAWYTNADGEVEPVDLRAPTSFAGLATIGNADVDLPDAPSWERDRDGAITQMRITYYVERPRPIADVFEEAGQVPDVAPAWFDVEDVVLVPIPYGNPDLNDREHEIDARGFRAVPPGPGVFSAVTNMASRVVIERRLIGLARSMESAYGWGPTTIRLPLRRTTTTDGLTQGGLAKLDVDEIPDPNTVVRGGARVVRILEISEDGGRRTAQVLDLGADAVAAAPSIADPTQNASNPRNAIDQGVTLNGDGDRARVDVAVTPTSTGVRPAEGSDLWHASAHPKLTGTEVIRELPAGRRVWTRARTEVGPGSPPRIPSGWVFPPGVGYVDTQVLPAPTGLAAAVQSGSDVVLTWANADGDLPVEVLLDGARHQVLTPGSTRYVLRGLTPSTAYTAEVRAVDPSTGSAPSATSSAGFTTGATAGVAPAALRIDVLVGERV